MTVLPPIIIEWIQPLIPSEIEIHGLRRHDLVDEEVGCGKSCIAHDEAGIASDDSAEKSRQIPVKATSANFARYGTEDTIKFGTSNGQRGTATISKLHNKVLHSLPLPKLYPVAGVLTILEGGEFGATWRQREVGRSVQAV
jgi:hypothetical protein